MPWRLEKAAPGIEGEVELEPSVDEDDGIVCQCGHRPSLGELVEHHHPDGDGDGDDEPVTTVCRGRCRTPMAGGVGSPGTGSGIGSVMAVTAPAGWARPAGQTRSAYSTTVVAYGSASSRASGIGLSDTSQCP